MLRQIMAILFKNFKLLIRSRSSALIFVLGPLMLIFLVGFAFNSVGTGYVDVGIYSKDYSEVTLSFVKAIADGPFRTLKYRSEQACVEGIRKGTISACILFPPGMDLEDTQVDDIIFYVDYSKVNIAWQVLDRIKKQMSKVSESISMDLTNMLLLTLDDVHSEVNVTYPLLADTKMQQDLLAARISQSIQRMDALDLRFDPDSFNTDTLRSDTVKTKNDITRMHNSIDQMLKTSKDLNDFAMSQAIMCANTPEEADDIRDHMDFNSVMAYKKDIDEAYADSMVRVNYSYQTVDGFDARISDMEDRMQANGGIVWEIRDNLTKSLVFVDMSKDGLIGVKSHLLGIDDSISQVIVRDAQNIVMPISTNIKPVVPEKTNLVYLFPNLMALLMMFISILLSATIVVTEKRSTAYFRNFISPSRDLNFTIASYLTNLILVSLQVGLILFIADIYFNIDVSANLLAVAVVILLLISLFTFVGMAVGYILNSQDTVTIGAMVVSSIMLFLSDVIMPLENMPAYISDLARFNPFIIGSDLFKKVALFQKPLSQIESGLFVLILYVVVAFGTVLLIQLFFKKQKIGKYANRYVMKQQRRRWNRLLRFSEKIGHELDDARHPRDTSFSDRRRQGKD